MLIVLPESETLARAAAAVGLDHRGATLLRDGSNVLFRLPGQVVARIGRPGTSATATKEVRVARWLTESGMSTVRPLDMDQPMVMGDRPVTWWHQLPAHRHGTTGELGAVLRQLHAMAPPPELDLPLLDPFEALDERIDEATMLDEDDRTWALDHLNELRQRVSATRSGRGPCLVHGDAWQGNLAVSGSGRPVLLDFEAFAVGDPDWDLILIGVDFTDFARLSAAAYRSFVTSYGGYDVTESDRYRTLADIWEFRWLTFVLSKITTRPGAPAEVRHRIECLRGRRPRPWTWTAF